MLQKNNKKMLIWQDESSFPQIIQSLLQNEILITSTDTIPGFLANTTNTCFEKLNHIKGERSTKPYLILVDSWEKLHFFTDYTTITPAMLKLINHPWEAALTFVFHAHHDLPQHLASQERTIAIRKPQHKELLQILASFNGLFSTSANRSGKPTPTNFASIDPSLMNEIAILVKDNEEQTQPSSTILDLTQAHLGIITILREGAYSLSNLEGLYDFKFKK